MHPLRENEIPDVIANRLPLKDTFTLPEEWRDESYSDFKPDKDYTVKYPILTTDRSTFGRQQIKILMTPQCKAIASIGREGRPLQEANPFSAKKGPNNINVGGIGIVEHALAMHAALGLRADYILSGSSFPTYAGGIKELLQKIKPHLKPAGNSDFVTVSRPLGLRFPHGGHFIALPDEGDHKLIIDHQVIHPKNAIGAQRVKMEITPEVFGFIAEARTNGYNTRGKLFRALDQLGIKEIPVGVDFGQHNVLFVDEKGYLNPKEKFNDPEGVNRELILHEVIDKLGPLGMVPGRFVGTLVTDRTNHPQDVEGMKLVSKNLVG